MAMFETIQLMEDFQEMQYGFKHKVTNVTGGDELTIHLGDYRIGMKSRFNRFAKLGVNFSSSEDDNRSYLWIGKNKVSLVGMKEEDIKELLEIASIVNKTEYKEEEAIMLASILANVDWRYIRRVMRMAFWREFVPPILRGEVEEGEYLDGYFHVKRTSPVYSYTWNPGLGKESKELPACTVIVEDRTTGEKVPFTAAYNTSSGYGMVIG